ncbi:hypothetical protein FOL47_000842 [Perkinsus chesapeaki]|uniref:Uncharacterized protein n=1 Tax=Perkinsus chesapeaki TaxID=330153 RepID=A0A7J6KU11_PERCH|nr:hypothetical protein FOL47_000842 [Perkinsus chesapeaki]
MYPSKELTSLIGAFIALIGAMFVVCGCNPKPTFRGSGAVYTFDWYVSSMTRGGFQADIEVQNRQGEKHKCKGIKFRYGSRRYNGPCMKKLLTKLGLDHGAWIIKPNFEPKSNVTLRAIDLWIGNLYIFSYPPK